MSKKATVPEEIANFAPTETNYDEILKGAEIEVSEPAPKPAEPAPKPAEPSPNPAEPGLGTPSDIDYGPGEGFDLEKKVAINQPKAGEKKNNSAIRQQLEKLAEERKALEESLGAEKTEREKLAEALKAAESRRAELEEQVNARNTEISKSDPRQHPDVRALIEPWESQFHSVAEELEDLGVMDVVSKQKEIVELSRDYANAQVGGDKAAIAEAVNRVRQSLDEMFGEQSVPSLMRVVRSGAKTLIDVNSKISKLTENFPQVQYESDMDSYRKTLEEYEKLDGECFNPAPELIEADPFDARVVLRNFTESSEELKAHAKAAVKFSRMVMLPPPPINPADLVGLDQAQAQAMVSERRAKAKSSRDALARILPEAILARQLLPSIMERLNAAEGVLRSERSILRGNRSDGIIEEPESRDEEGDITNFTPSNPELEALERELGLKKA